MRDPRAGVFGAGRGRGGVALNTWAQDRFECECFYWLNDTRGDPDKVADLKKRLAKHRKPEAIEKLVQGMRERWDEWYRKQQEAGQ